MTEHRQTIDQLNDEHFIEYQKLGGKSNRNAYDNMREVFIDHTHNAYVSGDIEEKGTIDQYGFYNYVSRHQACTAVINILHITDEEFEILFHSIDNVTAWT